MSEINIKEIFGNKEPLFLKPLHPDKGSAAERLALTEAMFEKWHSEINRTNLAGIPATLYDLYEDAAVILCRILSEEKKIVTRR